MVMPIGGTLNSNAWIPRRLIMKWTGMYFFGFFIFIGGVLAALWKLGVLDRIGTTWTVIGVVIALGNWYYGLGLQAVAPKKISKSTGSEKRLSRRDGQSGLPPRTVEQMTPTAYYAPANFVKSLNAVSGTCLAQTLRFSHAVVSMARLTPSQPIDNN